MIRMMSVLILSILCGACSNFPKGSSDQAAICKEIKHRLVFDGATTVESPGLSQSGQEWENRAELGRLNRDYHAEDCT